MMVDDLEEIVFSILEHHKDTLVLEDDLYQIDNIWIGKFSA